MASGRYTSRRLVELYTERIDAIDRQRPGAAIGDRAESRRAVDRRRARRRAQERGALRGPLHGIPVLIKDNIDTARPDDDDRRLAGAAGLDRRRATRSSSSSCAPPAR